MFYSMEKLQGDEKQLPSAFILILFEVQCPLRATKSSHKGDCRL